MIWTGAPNRLMSFLTELEQRRIYFQLNRNNDYSVTVTIFNPGEIWEVDFCESDEIEGEIRVEVFRSDGNVLDGPKAINLVNKMFEQQTD